MKTMQSNSNIYAYFICNDCGKIVDAQPIITDIPEEQKKGFDIQNGHIDLYGICFSCKKKTNDSEILQKAEVNNYYAPLRLC